MSSISKGRGAGLHWTQARCREGEPPRFTADCRTPKTEHAVDWIVHKALLFILTILPFDNYVMLHHTTETIESTLNRNLGMAWEWGYQFLYLHISGHVPVTTNTMISEFISSCTHQVMFTKWAWITRWCKSAEMNNNNLTKIHHVTKNKIIHAHKVLITEV